MDSEYDKKFKEMKNYIPFLEDMINRLENTSTGSVNPRQAQLDKIRSLRDLLLDKKKRMKMENLLKCEQVLVNLCAKVKQRDPFTDSKPAGIEPTISNEKSELETVRNKLKTVAKLQDTAETLPEIARANDVEFHYTGSKEPALFQRRPNKTSKSPIHSAQNTFDTNTKQSPSQQKRNYTRVLVSPERSPKRWQSAEQSSEKPLFSRRSPRPITPPPLTRKEKKKSKVKSRKTKNVNITLNVPQERLSSFATEDIIPRILNCKDGDVDIDTLRELRSQILGELQQTGKNDDISNLILQSYKKPKSNKKVASKSTKKDVEEGELSDSESEAIERIYGSLSVVDKDKKSTTQVKTIEDKSNQQRKIQICLVINSDKDNSIATDKSSKLTPVIDLSEFEMFSENESDKSKDIISVDSDSSPIKKVANDKTPSDITLDSNVNLQKITECITVDGDNEHEENQAVEVFDVEEADEVPFDNLNVAKDSVQSLEKNNMEILKTHTEQKQSLEQGQENVEQPPKFIANFYKPIEEQQMVSSTDQQQYKNIHEKQNTSEQYQEQTTSAKTDTNIVTAQAKSTSTEINTVSAEVTSSTDANNIVSQKKIFTDSKIDTATVTYTNESAPNKESISIENKNQDESHNIPLLNEPTVPPKATTDMLSEIDILQALKNEILNETISLPGTEAVTPALHLPKLSKVASAHEVMPKKRISIEKYKEKATISTPNPLFYRKSSKSNGKKKSKKQSLKLTEKECERFNFPKRLSLDDDDDDDIGDILSDDESLTEEINDSFGLDDIYGDLAPKSPDNEISNDCSTPPVIIPVDPVKNVVNTKTDVDMRALLPTVSQVAGTGRTPVPHSPLGYGTTVSPSPYSGDRNLSDIHNHVEPTKSADINKVSAMDPRIRRSSAVNSPDPYIVANAEKTPRSFANVVANAPNMTPNRLPNMTPSMTPSYMPSIPQLMTPNARTFEMTPSHQTFELDESSTRKHVYAPSFSMSDNREREPSLSKDLSSWEINQGGSRNRRSRWEESNIPIGGPKWETRDPRGNSSQNDGSRTPRYEDLPKYDKYMDHVRMDKYKHEMRDSSSYSKSDCPMTPVPSFGWSECPSTPGSAFGRQEAPMTPSHPFGRADCSSTQSSGLGNIDKTSNYAYVRSECPSTPSHPFGRSECPPTPSHTFGRGDCPRTPSHPFGRSESLAYSKPDVLNSNQKYSKDPRINRRPTEYELSSHHEKVQDYTSERSRKGSYKLLNKNYIDSPSNYERDRNVGRPDRKYEDRNSRNYDRGRRDVSLGRLMFRDVENERLYTRNRDEREKSVGRTPNAKPTVERQRSTSRAFSVGRELNKDNISFQSEAGRSFTINTSVKTTFQDFLPSGKPMQVFEYSFDDRRQRAASVGRTLARDNSVSVPMPKNTISYSKDKNEKFKRACSVGRETFKRALSVGKETVRAVQTLKEVKADFEAFRSKFILKKFDTTNKDNKSQMSPRSRKDLSFTQHERKGTESKQQYSSKKINRDPRMRKEQSIEHKSRYKIDRRHDSRNQQKSGIIYSNDNIARGTIMGSGFGVKNYKIPKIKRVEPEPDSEIKDTKKKISKNNETSETAEKGETKKFYKESDKKIKSKHSKETDKVAEAEPVEKAKSKTQNENKKSSCDLDSEKRTTRSKKNLDAKESKTVADDHDVVTKTRKHKKPVIHDSDSDSCPEKETDSKRTTKTSDPILDSPVKKCGDITNTSSSDLDDKELRKKPIEGSLDSSFGIDDIEIFSENLASDPDMENINALIADLDHDLDASKVTTDNFANEMENMLDAIDSPEGNSLGDISGVIQKDLCESNDTLQHNSIADDVGKVKADVDTKPNQDAKLTVGRGIRLDNPQNPCLKFEAAKNLSVDKVFATSEAIVGESDISMDKLVDPPVSKIDEDVVSTTAVDVVSKSNETKATQNIVHNDDQSVPDSTINKTVLSKTLPDSTNEIHCELSSDVTSTDDNAEMNKELGTQSTSQKETFNPIGSLLSILQDKSKIKELLSMLGEESSDNQKIKKKLEKLSEIVSDDENEELNKQDVQTETLNKTNEETEPSNKTENNKKMSNSEEKPHCQISDEIFAAPNKEHKDVEMTLPSDEDKLVVSDKAVDENSENNQDNTSSTKAVEAIDKTTVAGKSPSKIRNKLVSHSDNDDNETKKKVSDLISKHNKSGEETDKMSEQSNCEDNEPLVKKVTKKIKGKKAIGKSKSGHNKNLAKQSTRAAPAKTGVKKRGELQKLQEDIKEMFMRDDILNATGIRMCRLAKMTSKKECIDSGPVVVLEKVKEVQNKDQPINIRKKPGPKPKNKATENRSKSLEEDIKMTKPKSVPKCKPGPKSKKTKIEDSDPYEFDTESIAGNSTTKESDEDSSDSETGSLASSKSFGSSEVLADIKKKPKRKRRGIGGWQSGIIKSKNRKKKEQKQDSSKGCSSLTKPTKPVTIPDLNCFIDKSYCFQKGVTTYDCRLCVYSGSEIVNHYKKQHPHTEIPLSRMDPKTAELAIQQCEQKDFLALSKISSEKYTCRFCHKEFANNRMVLETFFWHVVSNHTGEFKHLCPECVNVTRCPFNQEIPPPPKDGGQLIGYICKKCNFTQISLENLKTHVIVHHSDEETEVFTINLAVMSNKKMSAMLRRAKLEKPRVLRSLRSNRSAADISDIRDDRSDASESSDQYSELDTSYAATTKDSEELEYEVAEKKPVIDEITSKQNLVFENDGLCDNTSVKMEKENSNDSDHDKQTRFDDTVNSEPIGVNSNDPCRGNSDEIVDYPHFKINYLESGAKEYVCCINGNDSHYKTSLMISMKKHIQSKHSEKWDGYCCKCKVIVTLQGVQSDFRDCLSHFLDKHMDDFPVLDKVGESSREEIENELRPELSIPVSVMDVTTSVPLTIASALPPTASELSLAIPARVATPPVERTASPSYIAVRPIAELLSRELVKEIVTPPEVETPVALPRIENVVSLGNETVPPAQPSPVYPTNAEPTAQSAKPFLYEDVQAEVMSKKHRVVLDAMMSKENLVRVFKCAGRFCSFTTDSVDDALMHATAHQRVGGEGALNCAYCNYDAADNGIDLVMHVFKEHSRCQFCCPLCFYRAAASSLVDIHFTKAHSGATKLKNVLRSTASITSVGPGVSASLLTRDVAVQLFVCNNDEGTCNFKTYTPGKFIEHLQQKHHDAASYLCNLCPTAPATPAELVFHLRSHGLKLYQCTWCVHGANNETELLTHVAAKHPNRQPQGYVRVITYKDGGMRVLPLANLNKKVPTEDVVPNPAKENPVKEAERSIDLEKLIGQTTMTDSTTRDSEEITEEPVEIPVESLPEDDHIDSDEHSAIDSLLTTTIPYETGPEPISTTEKSAEKQKEPAVVKTEPADVQRDLMSNEIICLDSDEETDTVAADTVTRSDDASKSSASEEVKAKRVAEVSRSSVTDEVSITKIIEEPNQNVNNQVHNIIDLSDDDLTNASNSTSELKEMSSRPNQVIDKTCVYKCPGCFHISKSVAALRTHLNGQCSTAVLGNMKCPHAPCVAVLPSITKLIAHYLTAHKGTRVHYCGVCNATFTSLTGAKLHIRAVHKVLKYDTSKTKDSTGSEIITVIDASDLPSEPVRISGRKTSTEIQRYQADPTGFKAKRTPTDLKKRYGIDDIDKLPISPILDTAVFCELCEFGTKVKLNMVRHLQQHAEKVAVPLTAPVNPVPHLESNEMHFDKMVNLASSSVASRAPDKSRDEPAVTHKIPLSESSRYPKYVPERHRYTCGAKGCSYISVDLAMFKCHWETLHAREEKYRCVHCPPHQSLDTSVPLSAARILGHLKMHDVNLYACSSCTYYHYRKHLVEKHIADNHTDGSVKIVREEYQPEPATPMPAVGAPTMDLKPWQCGLCNFSSMLRPKVVNHCATEHQSKMQFKCAYCPFRTSAKENVVKHQTNVHPMKPEEVFHYFYKEGSIPVVDGVHLWQKQRQKLGLDEQVLKIEPEPAESVPQQQESSMPAAPPVAVDLNIVKKEIPEERSPGTELSIEELCTKFGEFCEPDGIKYKCCLCNVVREHARDAMQCHLYEELNYRRWECVICSYKAFHKNGLHDHMASEHSRQFNPPRALPTDANIEKWVQCVLDHQAIAIESNLNNLNVQKIQGERVSLTPAVQKKPEPSNPAPSASDSELENAFGEFGAAKDQQYACPKCDFLTKDEVMMVTHLESELSKIRWGCTVCTGKYTTFHEAQFHCKSAHTPPSRPKEAIRDPSLRSGWVKAVVASQKQFIKCVSETNREATPERDSDDCEQSENSLLVAMYDEPVHMEEQIAPPGKRPAPAADSDDERLVIDEPPTKKAHTQSEKKCPICEYEFCDPRYVREHILKIHYNRKPYKCGYCRFEGTRQGIYSHLQSVHAGRPRNFVCVEVPNTPPVDSAGTSKRVSTDAAPVAKTSKRDSKDIEEVAKKVCLYCEKSVPENETETHSHGSEKCEFAKRGDLVVKCCKCLVLRLDLRSLQDHFDACHPGENVLDNYAYFKLKVDMREIYCCGHCYKKFKFIKDLKVHHSASHTSLSLSYTFIPFSHNLHTEDDSETGKRKLEEAAGPSTKRIAKKSSSKLPNSTVAKKSTTKLPLTQPDVEEFSYYGTKPPTLNEYRDLKVAVPIQDSKVQVDVTKLSESLKINPKVVLEDYKS